MSEDSYTEVEHEGWGTRLRKSIGGVVFGIVLFIASFPLLWWNEGRAVTTYRMLKEVGGNVQTVPSEKVDGSFEGKLVHTTGKATTGETLADSQFGISLNAIKLKREVEMYQWQEKQSSKSKKNVGGSKTTKKTYTYSEVWSGSVIDSGNFKEPKTPPNPSRMPFNSMTFTAKQVTLGAFSLPASLVTQIGNYTALTVTDEMLNSIGEEWKGQLKISDGKFYKGADPNSPQIGDTQVSFTVAKPAEASLIAMQKGKSFEPYVASNKKEFNRLRMGAHTAQSMVEEAQAENKMMTWILRVVGFALMVIGLSMVFSPLAVLADVLPFLGDLMRMGTGLLALLIAGALSFLTIAIAWIAYRPLVGIPLLVVAVGAVAAIIFMRKTKPSPGIGGAGAAAGDAAPPAAAVPVPQAAPVPQPAPAPQPAAPAPPPAPAPASVGPITVSKDGQQLGPYSVDQIKALVQQGKLAPQDYAWYDGLTDWVPISKLPGM